MVDEKRMTDLNIIEYLLNIEKSVVIDKEEKRFNGRIKEISDFLNFEKEKSILLLAGPSSSGKTTTANMIKSNIEAYGSNAVVVSLDNFYYDRDLLPLLPNGRKDYDSPETINADLLGSCLEKLIKDGKAMFPEFDFNVGVRKDNATEIKLQQNDVLIIEGLHALMPEITTGIDSSRFVKTFISVESSYTSGDEVLLSSDQIRLIRRMVRDREKRGSSAKQTYEMWNDVRMAEKKFINKYYEAADFTIDSFFAYELCLYHSYLDILIDETDKDDLCYLALRGFHDIVEEIPELSFHDIPDNSLMWEFFKKELKSK